MTLWKWKIVQIDFLLYLYSYVASFIWNSDSDNVSIKSSLYFNIKTEDSHMLYLPQISFNCKLNFKDYGIKKTIHILLSLPTQSVGNYHCAVQGYSNALSLSYTHFSLAQYEFICPEELFHNYFFWNFIIKWQNFREISNCLKMPRLTYMRIKVYNISLIDIL